MLGIYATYTHHEVVDTNSKLVWQDWVDGKGPNHLWCQLTLMALIALGKIYVKRSDQVGQILMFGWRGSPLVSGWSASIAPLHSQSPLQIRQVIPHCDETTVFFRMLSSNMKMEQILYTTLRRGELRLVHLHPGQWSDPISLSLQHFLLQPSELPFFEAVSYTWNNPAIRAPIICSGMKIQVMKSVETLLRRFRLAADTRYENLSDRIHCRSFEFAKAHYRLL